MTATLKPKARPVARTRAVWIVVAAAATGATWAAARGLGADLTANDRAVTLPAVIVATIVAGLAAWALLAVLERATRRAATAWTCVAVAVLVLSLAGPVSGAKTGGGTAALVVMHLAAAAVLIPGLRRTAAARAR
jgi:undecaprenyl pyrophosphate phosphatase UppP